MPGEGGGTLLGSFLEDKHSICAILNAWMLLICAGFALMGASHIPFFAFGPSPTTMLMGVAIDTWPKWTCVAMLTFLNTVVTEYVFDCFAPWIMTTVIDHKGTYIPYPKPTMMYFVLVSSTYRTLIQVVMIYVMLSQVDFLAVRVLADVCVTVLTTHHFLRNKVHDPEAYAAEHTMFPRCPSSTGAPAADAPDARVPGSTLACRRAPAAPPATPYEDESCGAGRSSLDSLLPT